MYTADDIRKMVTGYLPDWRKLFPALYHTNTGDPVAVYDTEKVQQYWLTPLLLNIRVRGIAMLDIKGNLISHGVMMPNVQDENQLPEKSYFEAVPHPVLKEIERHYRGYTISQPYFSYDATPRKWGWLVCLSGQDNAPDLKVFIGINGWYQKQLQTGREG